MTRKFPIVYYRTAIPVKNDRFEIEWNDCLQQLLSSRIESEDILFKLVIFCFPDNYEDYLNKKKYIGQSLQQTFGESGIPAFVLVCQKPENLFQVSVEAGFVQPGEMQVRSARFGNYPYVVFENDTYKELWVCGIEGNAIARSYEDASSDAFRMILDLLASEELEYNHIVRQWNYIGHILQESCIESTLLQNYQIYNEVRHLYYHQHLTIPGFPAATGIGNDFDGVLVDICAIRGDNDTRVVSVSNPKQVNAFAYGQEVLEGQPIHNQPRKNPPEFERAKLVINRGLARVFISGTASIIGQKTIGIDNIAEQTNCTIDNMEVLYSRENLLRCSQMPVEGDPRMICLRVYVKYEKDVDEVKRICEARYPGVPAVYSITDVCRNDLLVEMEGEVQF